MNITKKDLKIVWMGIMLVLLAMNASAFVHASEQKSTYCAPWIHPANQM
ncbi:MAG: hypothetical protein U0105_11510 [Candidatus Obscuribacterales bacterium]|jgi:hypothetical protein